MVHLRSAVVYLCLLFIKESRCLLKAKFEGCYDDRRNVLQLTIKRTSLSTLTIPGCNSFCFSNGFKFAATRNGTECHCGDLTEKEDGTPILPPADDNKLCDAACSYDVASTCGGRHAFTLYSTGINENDVAIKDMERWKIGCLDDSGGRRILAHHKVDLLWTNTPKRCVAYCRALGYAHAGVQYKFECHCGVAKKTEPEVEGCDKPCSGNANINCGGNWRLMLYSTQSYSLTTEVELNGCYKLDEDLGIVRRTMPGMTPEKCVAYCFYQGLPFAHIFKGTICMCSSSAPHKKMLSSMSSCEKACQGDLSKVCGGENHMVTYETGSHGDPSLGKLESCYLDSKGKLLNGPKLNLGYENSISYCISRCLQLSYAYAGVRNSTECQCSQTSPLRTELKMAPDFLCTSTCPRTELQNCGGERYTALYRTGLKQPLSADNGNRDGQQSSASTSPAPHPPDGNKDANVNNGGSETGRNRSESTLIGGNDIASDYHPYKVSLTKLFTVDGYVGCYSDDRSDVQLNSEQITAERTFTLQQCNTYCFVKGYKFAAAKNGNQCLCGDLKEENIPAPDDSRLCNVPCLSDLSTRCGGVNAYTVYSTGITENDLGDVKRLEIGCLSDEDETRLIKEHKTDLIRTNTPARCVAYCRRLGYPHAGVQYGIECFCGMASRTGPVVSGCDLPCSKDPMQQCGGHWRINLYSTGVFNNTMDVSLIGCFLYDETVAITGKTIQDMTPNKCIAHCFFQGLYYAHIYNGDECLCGRRATPYQSRLSMSKCNMTCKGDAKDICGGTMHMITYTTGVVGDPILGRFESCYRDDNNDLLSGPKLDLGNENSIHYCLARCIELGYAFAGLRNTHECQCSQESPKRSLLRMVSNGYCNSPCPRIELQQCGAANHLALHRTGITPYNERASGAVVPGYLGCYKDNRNEVRLTGHQVTARTMTVLMCNVLCFTMAFKHAATKDGKECYCGDVDGVVPKPDEDSLCNVQCISDIGGKCGGKNAFSLYSTGIKEDDIDLEDLEIGCISDGDDTRLIPEHKVDLLLTNTPKRCTAYCRALGYTHAGVQYSQECYCGSARKLDSVVDGCDKPCVGDQSLSCGGDWKANVYTTGITRPPPGVAPRGCYWHNQTLISVKKVIPNINENKCASHCYSRGFPMAYIYDGVQCLCGKSLPSQSFKAPPKKCDIKCDNSNSKCGGQDVMSAYTTGIIGDPSLGKLIGCFRDENNDLLSGPKLNLGPNNSIHTCIAKCIELGYAYAGLRNTFECQCSQAAPKRTPVKIVPDYECASPCPMFQLQTCGAPVFTAIHRTGVTASGPDCASTISKANGKSVCGGQVLFAEEFDTLDADKWEHTVKVSGEDAEFVTYTKKRKNIDVHQGKLVVTPTLVSEKFVKYGTLELKGCTGVENTPECVARAKSYHILPPVESGQICTRRSFNFRYGVITVRAKLPKGDWVVPQIWLKPVKDVYGSGYRSGKILLVTARGNLDLQGPEGTEIGAKLIESGFQVSSVFPYKNVETRTVDILTNEPWFTAFHNYSLTWTDDTMLFYIDGNVVSGLKTLFRYSDKSLLDEMGLAKDLYWKNGTIMAPFDQDFYICLGVSVGGVRSFPDDSLSNGVIKPWKNDEMKSRLKFWLNRNYWEPSWSEDTKLEVDSIKVTAY